MKEQIASMAIGALLELVKLGIDELKKRGAVDLGPIGYSASDFRKVDREVDKLIDAFYETQKVSTLMGATIGSSRTFVHLIQCEACRSRLDESNITAPLPCLKTAIQEADVAAQERLAELRRDWQVKV